MVGRRADLGLRNNLADSHLSLGILLSNTGRGVDSLAEFERARSLYEALARANPSVPSHRDSVASALTDSGDVLRDLDRLDEARDRYARAIAIREELVAAHPTTPIYRSHLAWSLRRLALVELAVGDVAGASGHARQAVTLYVDLPSRSGEEWVELACARATLSAATARDESAGPSAESTAGLDRAMVDFRKGVAMGHRDLRAIRREPALDPLRDRDDFRALMMDLEFPDRPFGP